MKQVDTRVGDMQRHRKRLNLIKESISRPSHAAPRHHPAHALKHAAHAAPKHAAHVTPQPLAESATPTYAISKPTADELRAIVESMITSEQQALGEKSLARDEKAHGKIAASETVIATTLIDNVKVELVLRKTHIQ